MQIGLKIDEIGACACTAYITMYCFSRYLELANASRMPHLPRNLILMILLFYRTILSCLEADKCVKSYFTMQILKTSWADETAVKALRQSKSTLGADNKLYRWSKINKFWGHWKVLWTAPTTKHGRPRQVLNDDITNFISILFLSSPSSHLSDDGWPTPDSV